MSSSSASAASLLSTNSCYQVLALIARLLRKRIVLALILTLSLTYCLVSLFGHNKTAGHTSAVVDDDYDGNSLDTDRLQHIIRQSQHLSPDMVAAGGDANGSALKSAAVDMSDINDDGTNGGGANGGGGGGNGVHVVSRVCRNSIQGKALISDERGFVCHRKDVLLSGCCDASSATTRRFSCDTCQTNGCCAVYEYCISCCLEPSKKPLLTKMISQKRSDTLNILMASITDHFELCLTRCRTSSASVQHENSYRDPKAKHCFGEMHDTDGGGKDM
ncbi:SREBP regulating gene protein-like [Oppia nitens]|uniref:SREBP regulating gene protein-like n=1 Tax=Oppia nitens TaxID=1686743 RepID=UPI0023DAC9C5|nr:SREBP regulating gene protein-like [Oppia nitens]